jgi:hypothetical protein
VRARRGVLECVDIKGRMPPAGRQTPNNQPKTSLEPEIRESPQVHQYVYLRHQPGEQCPGGGGGGGGGGGVVPFLRKRGPDCAPRVYPLGYLYTCPPVMEIPSFRKPRDEKNA